MLCHLDGKIFQKTRFLDPKQFWAKTVIVWIERAKLISSLLFLLNVFKVHMCYDMSLIKQNSRKKTYFKPKFMISRTGSENFIFIYVLSCLLDDFGSNELRMWYAVSSIWRNSKKMPIFRPKIVTFEPEVQTGSLCYAYYVRCMISNRLRYINNILCCLFEKISQK